MKKKYKIIFHIDLDAFFCAVEEIKYPFLKGKAFAIGRENSRGVISTASYPARRYGIKSAMPVKAAIRRYPKLILIPGSLSAYMEYSKKFTDYIKKYSNTINNASVDEAYLDVTEYCENNNIHPLKLARKIQDDLWKTYQLSASIGIAPTIYLAKMASELKKPRGVAVLRIREVEKILYDRPIDTIYGLGKKGSEALRKENILTIGDFLKPDNETIIKKQIGIKYYTYIKMALSGQTTNIVETEYQAIHESISQSTTFLSDISDLEELTNRFEKMTLELTRRLKKENKSIKTVRITLRYADFKTISRSKTMADFTDDFSTISDCVQSILEANYNNEAIRLIGVAFSKFLHEEKKENKRTLFD